MRYRAISILATVATLLFSSAAQAEISSFSIFPQRGFQTAGSTTNAGAVIGGGNAATVATFNGGGLVILDFGEDITDHTFTISATGAPGGPATVGIRFIFTSPGPLAFPLDGFFVDGSPPPGGFFLGPSAADFVLTIDGPGEFVVPSGIFTGACNSIGGCNSVVINTTSATGFTASIISSAPEPATWMLMIIAFAGVGARLKHIRRSPHQQPTLTYAS